jgi:hypothetical protein
LDYPPLPPNWTAHARIAKVWEANQEALTTGWLVRRNGEALEFG